MQDTTKVALITGGTHGIGAETAICLAKRGMRLSLVARNIETTRVCKELDSIGCDYHLIAADLCSEEECQRAVSETLAHFGSLHALVHAAGSASPGSLLNGARDAWYQAFDLHLHAAFHLSRAAAPSLKKSSGAIILISSAAGLRGVKNALAYATVKGALPQFARALAFELAEDNIRVNCVSPGIIRTRFQDHLTPEQVRHNIDHRIPLHREGEPGDVADAICMLIANKFITGENLVIDGGMTMRIV